MIRNADLRDLDALVDVEERSFAADRISRRSFRHLLTRGNARLLVDEDGGKIRGYSLLLFHRGTSLARLYSFAVAPEYRRLGIAKSLLAATEAAALEGGRILVRLEVRRDNTEAINLYTKAGYRHFGSIEDYYEDHATALRFEKRLTPPGPMELAKVPYYRQTLDFTCGPAALMMAMKAQCPGLPLDRTLELRLWREATTVFMTSGHGGCGPYGLALAAWHRGYGVEIYVVDPGGMFVDSVRSEEKKEVITLVQEDFRREIIANHIPLHEREIRMEEMEAAFETGGIPIVLISSARLYNEKFPHWVVVTGFDSRFVYIHDPFVDYESGKNAIDCMNMPIARGEFARMAKYGRSGQKACIILRPPKDEICPKT